MTRETLNCVRLEYHAPNLRFVATDGHTMWIAEIPAEGTGADDGTAWSLPLDKVTEVTKLLRSCLTYVDVDLAKHTVDDTDFGQRTDLFATYQYTIPFYFPDKVADLPEYAASYIGRCCEAFALYSKGFAPELPKKGTKEEIQGASDERNRRNDPPIAWRIAGALDPIVVYSPIYPNAMAVVMPRRGNENKTWLDPFIDRIRTTKRAA